MAAYAALLSLSQTIDLSIGQDKSLFSSDVEGTVRSIHDYVNFFLPFFQDSPEKVKGLEGRIRDVAYKIEDVIEFFMWQSRHKVKWNDRLNLGVIVKVMWQRIQSRHGMKWKDKRKLEKLLEEIGLIAGDVAEERPTYRLAPSSSSRLATDGFDAAIGLDDDLMPMKERLYGDSRNRQGIPITGMGGKGKTALTRTLTASFSSSRMGTAGNDAVIGLDNELIAIKHRLCGKSLHLDVIAIMGMGGIGKTTLAKTLYKDPLICSHFDIRAWAVASRVYSPRRFMKNLLDSMNVLENQMIGDEMNENETMAKVYKTLSRRRYLVVIDDVWGTNVWDDVNRIFPDDYNGSRIMLTSRLSNVAYYRSSNRIPFVMRLMNDSLSWELLKQNVFANGNCPLELEDVGQDIARRCAGLPLAVVLVAGILSVANESEASWEEIAENVISTVGGELEDILSLSYTNLPHHLRSCFLFIGSFQEDVHICSSRLIRLWVAEGFLKMEGRGQKSLEEKAEEYLEELVARNLVVVISRKIDGKIKSCTLHDIVRDFCIRKARAEKFLHVMDGHDLQQGLADVRRISISCSNASTVWSPTLRTILCFQIQGVPSWLGKLGVYKLLKELDASGVDLKEFPTQVFDLYHLRYLALMGSFSIPSAISNLVHLQTLIIHLASGKLRRRYADAVTHSLPLEIWRLPLLRHLIFHAPYMLPHPPPGLNLPLQCLQTLLLVADLVWSKQILEVIPNVKRLGLTYSSNKEHHLYLMEHLDHLEKLKVIGNLGFSWRGQIPSFPPTLKKLTLVGGGFPWSDMVDIVGSLPNLQVLKLLDNACDGEKWEMPDDGGFPSLMFLLIDGSNLCEWEVESNYCFRRLRRLVLRSCPLLMEIPQCIGEIPTLELIEVDYCTKSLLKSAQIIKEEQEEMGNCDLHVHVGREIGDDETYNIIELLLWHAIQSFYKQMDTSYELGDEPKYATEESQLCHEQMDPSDKLGDLELLPNLEDLQVQTREDKSRNMDKETEKALISSVIEKLQSRLLHIPVFLKEEVNEVISELNMILYILEENEWGEGSRLNFFICDVVEIAQEVLAQDFYVDCPFILRSIRHSKMLMLKLAINGEGVSGPNEED